MAHPSQTTLRIALRQFASYQTDAQGPVALTANETLIADNATNGVSGGIYYVYVDADGGQFLQEGRDYVVGDGTTPGSDRLELRKPLGYAADVYFGGCDPPDFVVPQGCRTVVMSQADNTNPFFYRLGTANQFGLPIGKEGDANTNSVQGSVVTGRSVSTEVGEWEPGTLVYLLASAASQIVVVQFNMGK